MHPSCLFPAHDMKILVKLCACVSWGSTDIWECCCVDSSVRLQGGVKRICALEKSALHVWEQAEFWSEAVTI